MKMRKKKKASVIDLKPYRSTVEIKKKIIKNKLHLLAVTVRY